MATHYAVTVTRRTDRPHRALGSYTIHVDPTEAPTTDRLTGDRTTYNNRETRRGVYGTLDAALAALHAEVGAPFAVRADDTAAGAGLLYVDGPDAPARQGAYRVATVTARGVAIHAEPPEGR